MRRLPSFFKKHVGLLTHATVDGVLFATNHLCIFPSNDRSASRRFTMLLNAQGDCCSSDPLNDEDETKSAGVQYEREEDETEKK